ncbi:RNA polymerase factor sigma-54 [Virgibacillus kekensis]|uniref:RNA polymerase factor sigma-54 n=1 Tax=Virgibacillus kekensis TaxID=202261 RepID=A0ABV9DFH3_9BACI
MRQKLIQEQTLQLKMNQSLVQAINLLQLTGVEVVEYIKEIAKENPLIEEVNYDYEIADFKNSNANLPAIGEINEAKLSMYDQLKSQLYTLNVPDDLEPVVLFGIDSLNEDGYLDIDLNLWAEKCGTTIEKAEHALTFIQSLEPAGIGARSLKECIRLQMADKYDFIDSLLDDHLDWVAEENIEQISEQFLISPDNAHQIIKEIQACHPKPGQLLAGNVSEYIIPEANIYEDDGHLKIHFYKWHTPDIEIDNSYADLLNGDSEAAEFLHDKYKQVEWLKQAVAFRGSTIERVIRQIAEKQQLYFQHGTFMLQPLTLREIAKELGMHVSTVSRAISNKYVQTRHGVIPLRFFLQTGVGQEDGKQTSSFVIKQLITELVNHEDKQKPLSDEKIKDRLHGEFGITIARRTVMKYREQLGILASSKRKLGRGV